MTKTLSFLEVVCVAVLVNVIHWQVTSSFTVDPQSSTVAEEDTTVAAAIEPTTPSPIEETTTTGPVDCSRYSCPADKHCVLNEASNRSECVCNTVCYLGINPVCGSDGHTHDNDCFLRVTACQTSTVITILHKGSCNGPPPTPTPTPDTPETPTHPTSSPETPETSTTTGPVDCSGLSCPDNKYCVLNETNNRPECICINFVPPIYAPVCGSDGQTYGSAYVLNVTACQTNKVITVQYQGRCNGPPTTTPPPTPSPETPETPESPTPIPTPETPTPETPETPTHLTPTPETPETPETLTTTVPSPTIPIQTTVADGTRTTWKGCVGFECPVDKECVLDANNRPTCSCIFSCDQIYRPVCGSDHMTYGNECELRRVACMSGTNTTVLFTGRCETICIGFECPINKVCAPDADNRPTCICIYICHKAYIPVCGSDSQTYFNDCYMLREACQANTTVTVLYTGRCKGPPTTSQTPPPTTPETPKTPTSATPPTPTPETPETPTSATPTTPTPETPDTTTTTATATTPSAQSTTKHRRSKCRRRKHGRRYKNKGL